MEKPSREEIYSQIERGARVFLFAYPENDRGGFRILSEKAQERVNNILFAIPGCKEIDGPHINGVMAITIEDTEQSLLLSDDEIRDRIARVFHHYWQDYR